MTGSTPTRTLAVLALAGALAVLNACATGPAERTGAAADANAYGSFLAARYAGALRDVEGQAEYYARALSTAPDDPVLIERAFIAALGAGDIEGASRLAERALDRPPADRLARIVLASDALKRRRYGQAAELLDDRDLGPFNRVVGALTLAWAKAGQGEVDAALAELASPDDAPILGRLMTLQRALILDRAGRAPEADAAYREALESGVLRGVVIDAYGRHLERAGRGDEAETLYRDHLAEFQDDGAALAGLARLASGARAPAFVDSPAQGASVAVFGPAATLAGQSNADLAAIYLRIALHLDPENGAARLLLGDIYSRAQLDEDALAVFAAASPGTPYYVALRNAEAWTLLRMERTDEGLAVLQALSEETGERAARSAYADALQALERFAEAHDVYDALIKSGAAAGEADDWRLFYYRGVCAERTGRWEAAVADFRQALNLSPDEASVLNYLGYTWVDRGENLEEAFTLIRRAVALKPEAGYIVDSLGWAHFKLNQFDEAVPHLERAVELDPDDPTINDHLGDAYWRVGRKLEASFQWERAMTLEPDDALASALAEKLKSGLPDVGDAHYASP